MATDMTKGRIWPQLVGFTVPLVLGNLFQLTYNAADSIIVGKFIGDQALAAVGTAGPIMNLVILFISGLCMGAGILMSNQYGAGEEALLKRQMSTTLLGGLALSWMLTICMIVFAPQVLGAIRVPEEILLEAVLYLRLIFLGLLFTFIYNFYSNTLRALGDSKTSLYFLMLSSLFNIVGDLFFVAVLHWGVCGSALATVLSQILCCGSCAYYIKKKVPMLCLGKEWLVLDRGLLSRTFSYGITSALQLMCVQLGKVMVQAVVNTRGIAFMAAFAATNRVDDFAMTPQQNIAHATTTFMAQNQGAGQQERMKQGFFTGMKIEYCYTAMVLLLTFFGARPIMGAFVGTEGAQVVEHGARYLQIIAFLYFFSATTNIIQGFFRGIGDLKITLISTMTNMGVRVAAAWILVGFWQQGFESLAWANLCGWIAMLLLEVPLLRRQMAKEKH